MFAREDQALLTGTEAEIEEFVAAERCVVVDWRSSEAEVLDDARRFLPAGSLGYEFLSPEDSPTLSLRVRFRDREDIVTLPHQPQNNFRLLIRLRELLRPDYEIWFFRCTDDGDTHGFLLRPGAWWDAFRAAHSRRFREVFRDVSDLDPLWNLSARPQGDAARAQPWWKIW